MYVLQNLHWFALLLGALVLFHEFGHFIVAKACGVKVLSFSLGFGPRLLGFRVGETDYQLSALPLGGYVKMLGQLPDSDVPVADLPRAFSSKPLWQRIAIVIAGPAFNFLLALLVYWAMFAGTHTFGATKLGVVSHDSPAWRAGLRPGDRIVSIEGVATEDWEVLREQISTHPLETLDIAYERDGIQHRAQTLPEAHTETDVFEEAQQRGRIGVSLQYVKPIVAVIDDTSPAAHAGLRTGDQIVAVNGHAIEAWHELRAVLHAAPPDVALMLRIQRDQQALDFAVVPGPPLPNISAQLFSAADPPDRYTGIVTQESVVQQVEARTPAADIGLQPGDRLLHLAVHADDGAHRERPIGVWAIDLASFSGIGAHHALTLTFQRGREVRVRDFKLLAREETDDLKNVRTRLVFGAESDTSVLGTYTFERHVGLVEALQRASLQVRDDATLISKGIARLVQGRIPLDTMGGPIMLFVIAEKSAKRGLEYFLRVLAVISVNLGLLNLVPVPALDGGHLLFFGLEAVRRRPPSLRTREIANVIGFALLLMLMVLVFRNDILRYVLG